MAMNSSNWSSHSRRLIVSLTPTMPSAFIAVASARMRDIASSRAWYIAFDSTSISWFLLQLPYCTPT